MSSLLSDGNGELRGIDTGEGNGDGLEGGDHGVRRRSWRIPDPADIK